MGLMDQIKNRLTTNWKIQRLSFMTSQREIVMYCRALEPAERPAIMQGIESMFKWQPVAQMAQGLFSSYFTPSGGVSDDAKDLVKGGYVDAGVELMRLENQPQVSQMQLGMTPMQQMALCYAWTVLRMLEEPGSVATAQPAGSAGLAQAVTAPPGDAPAFCSQCGTKTKAGGLFCTKCGNRL
jgi:hypothetical protein